MKKCVWTVKFALASLLLAGLAACGGTTTVSLGGSITGLVTPGLVLGNNGGQNYSVPANATSYVFPGQIDDASKYNVTVLHNPDRYQCSVSGGVGTATGVNINTANVLCIVNSYTLGGTISGSSDGLVLTNGADTLTMVAGATSFTFALPVADSAVYGVAVLTAPAGKTCTVQNGTAVMGAAPVTNVLVSCN